MNTLLNSCILNRFREILHFCSPLTKKSQFSAVARSRNLDSAFCQPKKLGGGAFWPPPNLVISSPVMMKLGKYILWVGVFTYGQSSLMTSTSY